VTEVVDALVAFAQDHGVTVNEPIVLSGTSNLVVHLDPAPVIARVPNVTMAGRDRPHVSLARELAMCDHLHNLGVATTPPSAELPPGPHLVGDRWVSFVDYVPLTPVDDGDAAEAGRGLADVIEGLRSLDDPDGLFDRSLTDEAEVLLSRLEGRIDDDDWRLLVDWVDEAMIDSIDTQPVHADPHRANVGRRADGALVWFDFDDAVNDSVMVDLATLQRSWPEAGAVACARFDVDPRDPEFVRYVEQREAWGSVWAQLFALELGERFTAGAAEALDRRRQ